MEVKREPTSSCRASASSAGFNPCFDGSEARATPATQIAQQNQRVSILVLMEVKREKLPMWKLGFRPDVSILVLMEVKRETNHSRTTHRERSFNPCFDGSEARAPLVSERGGGCRVSILVLMEVKREISRSYRRAGSSNRFQSLF